MNLYTRLINKDHPLPPDYVPENLTDIGIPFDAPCGDSKRLLEFRTAHAAFSLIQAAQKESLSITGVSGYRSYKRQQQLSAGNPYVAAPGTSEHQSGLALDVSCPSIQYQLIPEFAETPEGNGLREMPLSTASLSVTRQTKNTSQASPGSPGISAM